MLLHRGSQRKRGSQKKKMTKMILVENKVVIELKTVEYLTDVHTAQILTYMKLGKYHLGLLLNFHIKLLKQGIKRLKIERCVSLRYAVNICVITKTSI